MWCALQAWARSLVFAIACGVLVSLATGLVENQPEISIIGFRHYGYPLVWQVTKTLQPADFVPTNLAIDTVFWIVISVFGLIFLERIVFPKLGISIKYKTLLLPLALLIPLGLFMDVIHEFSHAVWGTAVGGTLAYMKIAYFEIFPQPAMTPQFVLGYVEVHGLSTDSQYGLFLLGGSLTTNIVSWVLAVTQLRLKLGQKTRVVLKILGLFGLLDLPLYVLLPQIGMQHWLFLGGDIPEPLIGARKIGIPDILFYIIVALATLDLIFLYFKPLRQKVREKIARVSLGVMIRKSLPS
jgi:hypothetical protein